MKNKLVCIQINHGHKDEYTKITFVRKVHITPYNASIVCRTHPAKSELKLIRVLRSIWKKADFWYFVLPHGIRLEFYKDKVYK